MGQHHPQQYLHNVASSVIGQIGGITTWGNEHPFADQQCDLDDFPQQIWSYYGSKILDAVGKMGPSARGRIAACGVEHGSPTGSLCHWEVDQGRHLDSARSGDELLTLLASYVVTAAIVDIFRAEVRKERDAVLAEEELIDQVNHYGPGTRFYSDVVRSLGGPC